MMYKRCENPKLYREEAGLISTYIVRKLNTVVEIPQPKKMGKSMGEIERNKLLVTHDQEAQYVKVILFPPNRKQTKGS